MQIRKATRKKAKLRLGIAAPSGAGKTVGALLIAFGITGDWSKIGLADTEKGSGELYVGQTFDGVKVGEYQYIRIDPDYTTDKYITALRLFAEAGVEAAIIDSTSHAWSGTGGLLDKQGKIAARTGNSYTAWRDVTPDHNKLVDAMLDYPEHLIATMRSKQEYVLEANDKGKQVPKKVGMAPVQREGMEYEFTVMLDIDMSHIASASKDRTNSFDGKFFKISPKTGQDLKSWLDIGIVEQPPFDWKGWATHFADEVRSIQSSDDLIFLTTGERDRLAELKKLHPDWHKRMMDLIAERETLLPKGEV